MEPANNPLSPRAGTARYGVRRLSGGVRWGSEVGRVGAEVARLIRLIPNPLPSLIFVVRLMRNVIVVFCGFRFPD